MKNLLYKEWKLVVIPVVYVFMALAFLLFVPGYPYTVVIFYNCLGIFLAMLTARENKDVLYMAMLPVAKEDIVKSRYMLVISVEMLQILLCAVIAVIKGNAFSYTNPAGIDANVAFFGVSFVLFAIFNLVFFGGYFKDVYKVGSSFIKAGTAVFVLIGIAEASVHIAAAVNGSCFWDSVQAADQLRQLPILAVGMLVFVIMTAVRYQVDIRHFMVQDL